MSAINDLSEDAARALVDALDGRDADTMPVRVTTSDGKPLYEGRIARVPGSEGEPRRAEVVGVLTEKPKRGNVEQALDILLSSLMDKEDTWGIANAKRAIEEYYIEHAAHEEMRGRVERAGEAARKMVGFLADHAKQLQDHDRARAAGCPSCRAQAENLVRILEGKDRDTP